MNLNLQILQSELEDLNFSGEIHTGFTQFSIAYPLLYDGVSFSVNTSAVYIMEAGSMAPEHWARHSISILCIGTPPKLWHHSNCSLLYTTEQISPIQLMNRVIQIFNKYDLLDQKLKDALKNKLGPKQLTQIMLPLFNNPISCFAFNYRCLFTLSPPYDKDHLTPWQQTYMERYTISDNSFLSYDDILLAQSYESPAERKKVPEGVQFCDDSGGTGLKMLCYNFTHNGKLLATIYIDEVFRPIRQSDYALCQILTEYLKQCLLYSNIYVYGNSPELEQTIHLLLGKKKLPNRQLQETLSSIGWTPEGRYYCIVFRSLASSEIDGNISYTAIDITAHFPDNIYVIKDQTIVMIVNANHSKTDRKATVSSLLPHLRDRLLMAAVSLEFNDLQQLANYYEQALSALTLGQKRNPSFWYFYYDDYILSRIVEGCSKYPAETMLPQGLKHLIQHDKRKGTSYTKLLKLYLQNERGVAATISKAYIHRSTFSYQIKKIEEICGMNLDDPQVRLTLLMAFEILAQSEQESKSAQ